MSLKAKLTSLIITFMLLASLLIVGVFAVKSTSFNVGGEIVFNAKGIEATITRVSTSGFTADKTIGNEPGNILSDIVINNDKTADDIANQFASWSGLNLEFEDGVTTATIVLTITNTVTGENPDNYLGISASASAATINNAKISVTNSTGGTTALLKQNESETFTISFEVIDDGYSASLNGFVVNFNLKKLSDIVVSSNPDLGTVAYEVVDGKISLSATPTAGNQFIGFRKVSDSTSAQTLSATSTNNIDYVHLNTKTKGALATPLLAVQLGANLTQNEALQLISVFNASTFMDFSIYTANTNLVAFAQAMIVQIESLSEEEIAQYESEYPGIINAVKAVANEGKISYNLDHTEGDKFVAVFTSGGEEVLENGYTYEKFTDAGISMIKNYDLPDGATSTEVSLAPTLGGCSVLGFVKEINLFGGDTVTTIFTNELTEITVPDSYIEYPDSLFKGLTKLTNVNLGSSITSIPTKAFYNCSGLTSITIPDSVTSIGDWAFFGCTGLTSVNYLGDINSWVSISFADSTSNPMYSISSDYSSRSLKINGEIVTNAVIDTATSIGDYAFYQVTSLKSITLGDNVTSIGKDAFSNCFGLTSITIPDSVTSIGDFAFSSSELTSITLGDNVTSIGDGAFWLCELTSITIPKSVTSIGRSAFRYCDRLTSITIPNSVTSIEEEAFYDCSNLTTVTIDSETISTSLTSSTASGYIISYATTVYVKEGFEVGSELLDTTKFTVGSSDKTGYVMYNKVV